MKLFILMTVLILQSCSMTYEKNFGGEEEREEREHRTYEVGTFR
jgi:hypothetical protein